MVIRFIHRIGAFIFFYKRNRHQKFSMYQNFTKLHYTLCMVTLTYISPSDLSIGTFPNASHFTSDHLHGVVKLP